MTSFDLAQVASNRFKSARGFEPICWLRRGKVLFLHVFLAFREWEMS